MSKVLALEINPRWPTAPRSRAPHSQRGGAGPAKSRNSTAELLRERGVFPSLTPRALELGERRHEGFRHVLAAVGAEAVLDGGRSAHGVGAESGVGAGSGSGAGPAGAGVRLGRGVGVSAGSGSGVAVRSAH